MRTLSVLFLLGCLGLCWFGCGSSTNSDDLSVSVDGFGDQDDTTGVPDVVLNDDAPGDVEDIISGELDLQTTDSLWSDAFIDDLGPLVDVEDVPPLTDTSDLPLDDATSDDVQSDPDTFSCAKDCTGRECGPDPVCGKSCGSCPGNSACDSNGQCTGTGCVVNCGVMVDVPSGEEVWQGCLYSTDNDCQENEYPARLVNVPAFAIDQFLVTVDLYGDCVSAGACSAPGTNWPNCNWNFSDRSQHPVNCVDWHQATSFCAWAGKRLCTESEWEYAARGTDARIFPWGNQTATCDYAVMEGDDGVAGCGANSTMPVRSMPMGASPFAVHDMAGNVFEWVEDDWHDTYQDGPTDGGPWIDNPRGYQRAFRGGSFRNQAENLRISLREGAAPAASEIFIGFRCCAKK